MNGDKEYMYLNLEMIFVYNYIIMSKALQYNSISMGEYLN